MSWRGRLALAALCLSSTLFAADDQGLWHEYGLVHSETVSPGRLTLTTYQLKDPNGALAAWEWQQSPKGRTCSLAPFCNQDGTRTVLSDFNYVLVFDHGAPSKADVDSVMSRLPNKHDSSLPAILTFLPEQGLVANSARYLLGSESINAFAPELKSIPLGFEQGAEAQLAEYRLSRGADPLRLLLFDYPTPEMARLHSATLKKSFGDHVKRSGVLVALVLPPATSDQSSTLLSRVQYQAKVTWNDSPPPSPIKPLYRLFLNIIYVSIMLSVLCLAAGLFYAAMRIYRRRHGTLDADEAMTTLHLTGD